MSKIIMNWPDYIGHQVKTGVFDEASPYPENDPRVWQKFLSLVKSESPDEPDAAISVLADRYGFFLDAIDGDRDGANVAGSTSLIDICLGVDYASFSADLPRIHEEASEVFLTDTFSFKGGYGAGGEKLPGLAWLNSPVADITTSFDAYLETLTTERRKKFRRSVADFEKTSLRFDLSDRGLSAQDLDFVRGNLQRKWGADADYAFRQTLWAHAVQTIRPQQVLIMRVMDGDKLVFIQTMIVKGQWVYCQSIAKDEDNVFNGLAAFTDFQCIKALCGKDGYAIFDASCRCSLDDPESIGIAKRATVNKNCLKPVLAIGTVPAEIAAMLETGHIHGKEA